MRAPGKIDTSAWVAASSSAVRTTACVGIHSRSVTSPRPLISRDGHELVGLFHGDGQTLLDDDVLPGAQRRSRLLVMKKWSCAVWNTRASRFRTILDLHDHTQPARAIGPRLCNRGVNVMFVFTLIGRL